MQSYSALITGGAQGIGKAIAKALVDDGLHVVILDSAADAGDETVEELGGAAHATFIEGDAASEADVQHAVAIAAEHGKGLRAAVGNTGIMIRKPVTELTLEEWNRVLAVNLTAAFLLARHAAPQLAKHAGAMLLIASSRALMSEANTESYSASKGGIVALTHSLAISLGPSVRVNCISPGWIATDAWQFSARRHAPKLSSEDHAQHPAGRVGTPPDIGTLASFLLSDKAGFITGANYVVDGGMTRKMIYAE
jgi:NAD(P)-dependent dehydrogenase (short-subunit alcohol dehydrogenase family)